tara:strand:- start:108 stop:596 length:489 start_codon:yes stop_codon:yes gene_type:complete
LESRKYQLKQQIIEALKAKDNDLFSLLKSQWAHRFGVESLEELQNLEITPVHTPITDQNKKKNEQSQDRLFDVDEKNSKNDDDSKEIESKKEPQKAVRPNDLGNEKFFEIKSNELINKENYKNKINNKVIENKNVQKIDALVPLPPKPKYSYLNKWLFRSYS